MAPPFDRLDFVYMPSRDPAAEIPAFEALGAEVVFAIEAFGARVAMLRLAPDPPHLLLADHLDGDRPFLVYRVPELEAAERDLAEQGATLAESFGFPHGPARALDLPGGHRVAFYELTRPERAESLTGRRDF
jgi:hypothetical protein